ncbi:hypothetical protein [Arundinibacter roseus]|uniref:Uncharacterized protein n=1 Tax=Arundinibacter roseus TaxID=2070510 RepID=A0A4R4KDP3_9BACT|nr:hypothetical protein [Arundinibacter roseus]TDB65988.1 hypothetical protein EZE20_09505 [Arundinibacter roseus]
MKLRKIAAVVAGVALLSSCEYQKYNKAEQIDVRAGNEWVYGVSPDSSARQLANKYEDNPEVEKRVNAIRAKLFDGSTGAGEN